MVVQHIAGLPVEEILLAALAAAAPAGDARLRDYEFGGSESGQGVDG